MPEIVLENVTKRWDKFYAVDDLNLVIDDNAFNVIGTFRMWKTTTLRMIAGLETPTSGRITIEIELSLILKKELMFLLISVRWDFYFKTTHYGRI